MSWCGGTSSDSSNDSGGTIGNRDCYNLVVQLVVVTAVVVVLEIIENVMVWWYE